MVIYFMSAAVVLTGLLLALHISRQVREGYTDRLPMALAAGIAVCNLAVGYFDKVYWPILVAVAILAATHYCARADFGREVRLRLPYVSPLQLAAREAIFWIVAVSTISLFSLEIVLMGITGLPLAAPLLALAFVLVAFLYVSIKKGVPNELPG
jgi:hypothetical protein